MYYGICVRRESIVTFRLEYEDYYDYEFSVLSSEHAQFKIFRCLTVMRMAITENLYSKSFSSSNLKVANNTFKRTSQFITT